MLFGAHTLSHTEQIGLSLSDSFPSNKQVNIIWKRAKSTLRSGGAALSIFCHYIWHKKKARHSKERERIFLPFLSDSNSLGSKGSDSNILYYWWYKWIIILASAELNNATMKKKKTAFQQKGKWWRSTSIGTSVRSTRWQDIKIMQIA